MILIIKSCLLILLLIVCFAILIVDHFLFEVIYLGLFSILMSLLYLVMSAPDVAITESAVGACMTTLLLLWSVAVIKTEKVQKTGKNHSILGLFVVLVMGGALLYAISDLPEFGSALAPPHNDVYQYYIANTKEKFGFPNVVTAILAGFRGYDTFGETVVVFTAAISILLLLKRAKEKK